MDEKPKTCPTCGGMRTIDYRTHFGDENKKTGKWMRTPCPTCSDPNKPTEAAWNRKGNVMDEKPDFVLVCYVAVFVVALLAGIVHIFAHDSEQAIAELLLVWIFLSLLRS